MLGGIHDRFDKIASSIKLRLYQDMGRDTAENWNEFKNDLTYGTLVFLQHPSLKDTRLYAKPSFILNITSIILYLGYRLEEWDPASNDFILRCNSCWRTNAKTKIIRTSREKYYCLDCLSTFDLCQG